MRSHRFDGALAAFDQVLAFAPDNASVLYSRACALAALRRIAEALDALESATSADPHLRARARHDESSPRLLRTRSTEAASLRSWRLGPGGDGSAVAPELRVLSATARCRAPTPAPVGVASLGSEPIPRTCQLSLRSVQDVSRRPLCPPMTPPDANDGPAGGCTDSSPP